MKRIALIFSAVASAGVSSLACGSGTGTEHAPQPRIDEVTQAATAAGRFTYAFDNAGLSSGVGDGTTNVAITRTGGTLAAGSDRYTFDDLGRVNVIDDLTLAYGADGNVARATRGASTVSYLYDENGQRIAKSKNGAIAEAYTDDGIVTATELDEPVKVAGKLVGVLRNARFTLAATDARGTVEADSNGTTRLASPFGARPVHPDVASIADYTEKPFDADFGATRMGVRDYDARIARFLQPDPLYLEHPDKCIASPLDCNLYGYARGNPLSFTDPSGMDPRALTTGVNVTLTVANGTSDGVVLGGEVGIIWSWHHLPRFYVSWVPEGQTDGGFGISGGISPAFGIYHDESDIRGRSMVTTVSGGPGSGGFVQDSNRRFTALAVGKGGLGLSVTHLEWKTCTTGTGGGCGSSAPAAATPSPSPVAAAHAHAASASPSASDAPTSAAATTAATEPLKNDKIDFTWGAIEDRNLQMQNTPK